MKHLHTTVEQQLLVLDQVESILAQNNTEEVWDMLINEDETFTFDYSEELLQHIENEPTMEWFYENIIIGYSEWYTKVTGEQLLDLDGDSLYEAIKRYHAHLLGQMV
jgi:hypothetical protein